MITILTYFDDTMEQVGSLASRINSRYAKKHGYDFRCQKGMLDAARDVMWNKVAVIKSVLDAAQPGWTMWIDADAIFNNHMIIIESIVGTLPKDCEIAFGGDDNGLCSGVMLIRNGSWASEFFGCVYFLGDASNEEQYGHGKRAEQNSIKALIRDFSSVSSRIVVTQQRVMNSYPHTFGRDDFVMHLSSFSNEERTTRLGRFLDENNYACSL